MDRPRVFQVANEFSVDVKAVVSVLRSLGESIDVPEARLSSETAAAVRQTFRERGTLRNAFAAQNAGSKSSKTPELHKREARRTVENDGRTKNPKRGPAATLRWSELQRQAMLAAIPKIFSELEASLGKTLIAEPVVVCHEGENPQKYRLFLLSGGRIDSLTGPEFRRVIAPLEEAHKWYREKRRDAPNVFVVFDLENGHAWFSKKLSAVQDMPLYQRFDASTLERVKAPTVPTTGEPPRLAYRAHRIGIKEIPALKASVGEALDAPDEIFLLDEDFLRLAVDSLDGAEVMTPLPVHVNALWVFSRPIVMQRSDGSDRHIRAVWFREGTVMWRARAYVSGKHGSAKQVGEQISGRVPFVAVWDETRPEQKLIAAIWALMSQCGVSERERMEPDWNGIGRPVREDDAARGVNVVRIKAGTEYAAAYGREPGQGSPPQGTFSVRGHWRQQPYPSLGLDDDGYVVTKPVWIATYTKGSGEDESGEKVILVKA